MNNARTAFLSWLEQGHIPAQAISSVLRLAGLTPNNSDWRKFFDTLMLWLGSTFCAFSVIFFFAYNWHAIGLITKFGLLELLIILSLALCWRLDINAMTGKSALLFATLLIGTLLALVGQTYQTGADSYELFTVWAIAVLPWVAVSCFSALWLFWLGLLNIAAILYYQTFGGLFGVLFDSEQATWLLFILNTLSWIIREIIAIMIKLTWLVTERWTARVLAVVSGSLITFMMMSAIIDFPKSEMQSALWVYPLWMIAVYIVYRHILLDVFVLAGAVLSGIIIITVWLSDVLLDHTHGEAGAFLFIGLVIIALSALGGFWLKTVARLEQS